MSDAAKMVFHIQELCDQIAHHIALDKSPKPDLNSVALISQRLCISAQSQIFRHVDLDRDPPDGFMHHPHATLTIALSRTRRLSAILTVSPHLLRRIRHLTVLGRLQVLELVSNMRIPLLQRIIINFADTPCPDDGVLRLSRDLIGLASIREVAIVGLYERYEVPSDLRLDLFASLFETCTADIYSLSFISVSLTAALPTTPVRRSTGRRPHIKKLRLYNADDLAEWFLSLSCPFDFTHLVEVETNAEAKTSDILQVLTSARLSLARLLITGDILPSVVDLSEFPALTCLEIEYLHHEAISTLKPDNLLETIALQVRVHSFEGSALDLFSSTDVFVANFPLPVLKQVEVKVFGPSNDDFGFQLESVTGYFPHLLARGLLLVTDHRRYQPPFPPRR
ncbi:hypothetical protein FB451DRAFT_1215511 [Mycena latifolia]|nr:hypothetical protein FB451DRAFT_1215511 [Mycena latifolia]